MYSLVGKQGRCISIGYTTLPVIRRVEGALNLIIVFAFTDKVLQTNIHNYGLAVMLSVNISAYKGDIPRNHVLVCA